jgi:hypothetical protein
MADQNNIDLLNRLVARVYRCLLQYTVECWPWTTSSESSDEKSPEQKTIEEMAARQQEFVARLADLLSRRGVVPDFGNYPDNSELHYVALDYLIGKLIADEERLVAELESSREAFRNDPPAATLIVELLAAEKENLARLRDLATKAITAVPA